VDGVVATLHYVFLCSVEDRERRTCWLRTHSPEIVVGCDTCVKDDKEGGLLQCWESPEEEMA